jgi:hypothetical protein
LTGLPDGSAQLKSQGGEHLTMKVDAFGLAPGDRQTFYVSRGSCLTPTSQVAASFGEATTDASGRIVQTLMSTQTSSALPTSPIYIAVAPAGTNGATSFVGCSDLDPKHPTNAVRIYPAPGDRASARVTLSYDKNSQVLTVTTKAIGLKEGTYAGAIRSGLCTNQGAVKYALDALKAVAGATTTEGETKISHVDAPPPPRGWSVQFQDGAAQTARPLMCGAIQNS